MVVMILLNCDSSSVSARLVGLLRMAMCDYVSFLVVVWFRTRPVCVRVHRRHGFALLAAVATWLRLKMQLPRSEPDRLVHPIVVTVTGCVAILLVLLSSDRSAMALLVCACSTPLLRFSIDLNLMRLVWMFLGRQFVSWVMVNIRWKRAVRGALMMQTTWLVLSCRIWHWTVVRLAVVHLHLLLDPCMTIGVLNLGRNM